MIRQFFIVYYLISLFIIYGLSPVAFAAPQLQATVEPVQVAIGETLKLNLELSGISDQDLQKSLEPDLTPLQGTFTALGQKRFESFQMTNGVALHQIRWQYTLEPQKTGTLTIPALSLMTATGLIFSQPLTVTVGNTQSQASNSSSYVEAIISNEKPYLYQPIYYTLQLYHRGDLRDPEPLPPANDIILEQLTQWTERREKINGNPMVINEIVYLLTPLKSGKLELAPSKLKALKPDSRRYNSGFGFSMFTDYLPITLSSSSLTLDVQPPVGSQQPWLPLNKLKLEQKWEGDLSQPVTVGVPLVRALTVTAEGMGGQPLPELENFVQSSDAVRVRSPKPDIKRSLLADGKTPVSELKQSFSVTPLVVGALQLPAIRLPWWDVEKNSPAWAELPAQTIQVIENPNNVIALKNVGATVYSPATPQSEQPLLYFNQLQYLLLMSSVLSLFIALGYSWYRRRSLPLVSVMTPPTSTTMSTMFFKQQLLATDKLADIKQLIQTYACSHWQTHSHDSLLTIAQQLVEHYEYGEATSRLLKQLDSALYGHQPLELSAWKASWVTTIAQLKRRKEVADEIPKKRLEPFNYG